MPALDPSSFVDNERPQRLLQDMIEDREEARVLVLTDISGQGKSHLLLRMRVNCQEGPPRVPVLFADLRDIATPFGAVERAASDDVNMDVVVRILTGYSTEYERWRGTAYYRIEGPADVVNRVQVDSVAEGGIAAGQYFASAPQVSGLDSRIAQAKCVLAFMQDLIAWQESPVVVLLDHFNKAHSAVQTWVDEQLVRPCLRAELGRTIVVLASTPEEVPSYEAYRPRVQVTGLDPLYRDPQHVTGLFRAHRLPRESDELLLPLALDRLRRGVAVGQLIDAFSLLSPAGGGHER